MSEKLGNGIFSKWDKIPELDGTEIVLVLAPRQAPTPPLSLHPF